VILHCLRAAASGVLAFPTGSRIAQGALGLFLFALPVAAHALSGTADAFCQKAGFAHATEFTVANGIGAQEPTLVVGDGKLCTESFCDGFAMIQCTH
jgi:predicted carbohydrate-binding protein with CBM5 and CBM33 domain